MATLDVFESLDIKEGQISAEIWVANFQEGHHENLNIIHVGWNVSQFIHPWWKRFI
jgi:hypothetical protein